MKALPIYERFHAFQGEGVHMGRSAFFIRTYGCPLQCSFCDSAGTWHKDHVPQNLDRLTPEFLAEEAHLSGAAICVVTGGEPTIFDLTELGTLLRRKALPFHIETSGAVKKLGAYVPDWVTLSPKRAKAPLPEWVQMADEFKLIIQNAEDVDYWVSYLSAVCPASLKQRPIWLHPECSKRNDPTVLKSITAAIRTLYGAARLNGLELRAGYQLHKLYLVDEEDPRSRPRVPLGGVAA